jgi:hypothetical protein
LHHEKHCFAISFSPANFWPQTTRLSSPTHPTFPTSPIKDKTERPPFWHNWCDRDRIAGGAEYPHKTRLSWCIWKWQNRW